MTDLESLNREVAERVMGWTVKEYCGGTDEPEVIAYTGDESKAVFLAPQKHSGDGWTKGLRTWKPSTDIAAAFEVVGKVCGDNSHRCFLQLVEGRWTVELEESLGPAIVYEESRSLPEAICRAALQVSRSQHQ